MSFVEAFNFSFVFDFHAFYLKFYSFHIIVVHFWLVCGYVFRRGQKKYMQQPNALAATLLCMQTHIDMEFRPQKHDFNGQHRITTNLLANEWGL